MQKLNADSGKEDCARAGRTHSPKLNPMHLISLLDPACLCNCHRYCKYFPWYLTGWGEDGGKGLLGSCPRSWANGKLSRPKMVLWHDFWGGNCLHPSIRITPESSLRADSVNSAKTSHHPRLSQLRLQPVPPRR